MQNVIDIEQFNLAMMDAVATMHRKGERAEPVFAIVNSTGAATRAREGALKGKMVEKAQVCRLAYVYIEPKDGRVKLAFNSLHTSYSAQEWFDQEILSDIRRRSSKILLKPLPFAVEAYLLAKSYEQAIPYKFQGEAWLLAFYSQLAEGLEREVLRDLARAEADRVAKSIAVSAVLAGLPAEFQQQIQGGGK